MEEWKTMTELRTSDRGGGDGTGGNEGEGDGCKGVIYP